MSWDDDRVRNAWRNGYLSGKAPVGLIGSVHDAIARGAEPDRRKLRFKWLAPAATAVVLLVILAGTVRFLPVLIGIAPSTTPTSTSAVPPDLLGRPWLVKDQVGYVAGITGGSTLVLPASEQAIKVASGAVASIISHEAEAKGDHVAVRAIDDGTILANADLPITLRWSAITKSALFLSGVDPSVANANDVGSMTLPGLWRLGFDGSIATIDAPRIVAAELGVRDSSRLLVASVHGDRVLDALCRGDFSNDPSATLCDLVVRDALTGTGVGSYDNLPGIPIQFDGTIVVASSSESGDLFAVDVVTGLRLWTLTTGDFGGGYFSNDADRLIELYSTDHQDVRIADIDKLGGAATILASMPRSEIGPLAPLLSSGLHAVFYAPTDVNPTRGSSLRIFDLNVGRFLEARLVLGFSTSP